ncbi:hypothetical protein PAMP_002236 [Pampus punctatissimus]
MKTFSVAVAVAVVLTFICIQESSAVPVTEVQEVEMMIDGSPVTGEVQMDSWMKPQGDRLKRALYCGRCCDNGVCRRCCYAK